METASALQVIGSLIALGLMIFKWKMDRDAKRIKEKEDEDKKIDSLSDADGIMRGSK